MYTDKEVAHTLHFISTEQQFNSLYVQRQSQAYPVVTPAAANVLGDAQKHILESAVRHVSINGITLGRQSACGCLPAKSKLIDRDVTLQGR